MRGKVKRVRVRGKCGVTRGAARNGDDSEGEEREEGEMEG